MTSNTKAGRIQTTAKQKCKETLEIQRKSCQGERKAVKDTFIKLNGNRRDRIKQVHVQDKIIHKKKASILPRTGG